MRADLKQQELINELYQKHMQAIEAGKSWLEIWKIFTDDKWYQACMSAAVATTKKRFHLSGSSADDLRQEAELTISSYLWKSTDLSFNQAVGDYLVFLKLILFRACFKAAGRIKMNHHQSLPMEIVEPQPPSVFDAEFWDEVHRLSEPARSIISCYIQGGDLSAIAQSMGLSRATAYRHLQQAIEQLRLFLSR